MTTRVRAALVLAVLVVLQAGACSSNKSEDRERAAAPASVPSLPDLSKLVPTVQTQLQAQHDVLVRTLESSSSTPIERGRSRGTCHR